MSSQFIGTFILVLVIFAVTDQRNTPPTSGLVPLAIFFAILGIAGAFGMQTGFALNPARDLGPRIMTSWSATGTLVRAIPSNKLDHLTFPHSIQLP